MPGIGLSQRRCSDTSDFVASLAKEFALCRYDNGAGFFTLDDDADILGQTSGCQF